VCRLVRQKNMDILLQAFALCLERLPDLRLLIVGDGPR
jgi:glycosyltransferase involved in cell wall biosynthesis